MNKLLTFNYYMFGYSGLCYGVSVQQAVDNAKVRFLKQAYGITVKDPTFRHRKSQLAGASITLRLASTDTDRFKILYRQSKDGDLNKSESPELDQLIKIIRDERLSK